MNISINQDHNRRENIHLTVSTLGNQSGGFCPSPNSYRILSKKKCGHGSGKEQDNVRQGDTGYTSD